MRLALSGLTVVVATYALAPVGAAFAPQPSNYTPATVVFRDLTTDAIKSDVVGRPYVNGGTRGLEVRMWTCADCSKDLTIGTFASGRTLYFDYRARVSGSGPTGTMNDNAFVNIRDIAAMVAGETKITRASFNTSVGYFRWLGAPPHAPDPNGSLAVEVTRSRDNPSIWTVSTSASPVVYPPGYSAGDLSVLLKDAPKNTLALVGQYRMPFGLTVTCSGCP